MLRKARFNRFQSIAGLGAIGSAGLRHVRTAAAAFAAQGFGPSFDEIDGAPGFDEIVGHADREPRLAVLGDADDRDDTGADLLLAVIDEPAQILRIEALHRACEKLDVADVADGIALLRRAAAATEGKLTLGVGQLLFEDFAFLDEVLQPFDEVFGTRLQYARGFADALILLIEIRARPLARQCFDAAYACGAVTFSAAVVFARLSASA